jgi:hypothetical protein
VRILSPNLVEHRLVSLDCRWGEETHLVC